MTDENSTDKISDYTKINIRLENVKKNLLEVQKVMKDIEELRIECYKCMEDASRRIACDQERVSTIRYKFTKSQQKRFYEIRHCLQILQLEYEPEREITSARNSFSSQKSSVVAHSGTRQVYLDIKVPKFRNEDNKHPMEYLNDLDKCFRKRNLSDSTKLLMIKDNLEDEAKSWFENNKSTITTFDSFKKYFRKTFFSTTIQLNIKEKWRLRQFKNENMSLEAYFFDQLRIAEHFEPKMSNFDINFKISKQLPSRAREALVGVDFYKAQAIITRLRYLDSNPAKEEAKDKRRDRNEKQNNQIATQTDKANERETNSPRDSNKSYKSNRKRIQNQSNGCNNRNHQKRNEEEWKNQYLVIDLIDRPQFCNNYKMFINNAPIIPRNRFVFENMLNTYYQYQHFANRHPGGLMPSFNVPLLPFDPMRFPRMPGIYNFVHAPHARLRHP